jgi:hypothetical protein
MGLEAAVESPPSQCLVEARGVGGSVKESFIMAPVIVVEGAQGWRRRWRVLHRSPVVVLIVIEDVWMQHLCGVPPPVVVRGARGSGLA